MKTKSASNEKSANNFLRHTKNNKGITLIALVVTIIVLIILSVITINAVIGEKGIINKAQNAEDTQKEAEEKDQIKVALLEYKVIKAVENANKDLAEFMEEQEFCTSASKNADNTVTVTMKSGNKYDVTGDAGLVEPLSLKAGDFVRYNAGTWTQEEINSLGSLYSGEALPPSSNPYKFGGFKAGSSKDASITPYSTYANQYSGWRVLSNTNGEIKIVHAGTPEGYYHPYETKGGYKSEYILNKDTTNSNVTATIKGEVSTTRDWSMYENSLARPGSAHCLTWSEISGVSSSNSLRKTGSYYWLANGTSSYTLYYIIDDGDCYHGYYDYWFGVRPVVSLRSDIQIVSGSGTEADPYILQ